MGPKGQLRRQKIVETALHEASAVGLEGITLGVLADHLNISKSGLFAHFRSKEELQLAVLEEAVERFIAIVVRPALREPRGEPRVAGLWRGWLRWGGVSGAVEGLPDVLGMRGCFFMSLAAEYDDRPGPVRDALVRSQVDWLQTLTHAAAIAVQEGHFRSDLDVDQLAYEIVGLGMALQHGLKLVGDPKTVTRANQAFQALLERARVPRQARILKRT